MNGTFKGLLLVAAMVGFSQVAVGASMLEYSMGAIPERHAVAAGSNTDNGDTYAIPERHAVGPDVEPVPSDGAIPERHAISTEITSSEQTKLDLNAPF